jgi:hypothetical protein
MQSLLRLKSRYSRSTQCPMRCLHQTTTLNFPPRGRPSKKKAEREPLPPSNEESHQRQQDSPSQNSEEQEPTPETSSDSNNNSTSPRPAKKKGGRKVGSLSKKGRDTRKVVYLDPSVAEPLKALVLEFSKAGFAEYIALSCDMKDAYLLRYFV